MRKLKKILVFLCLVAGCVCCFCSCSCSSKKPPGTQNPPDSNPSGPGLGENTYYNVSVTIEGGSESGYVISSTGSNRHQSGSSPVYTITPARGYAIESISVDNGIVFLHTLNGGYCEEMRTHTFTNIDKNSSISVTFKRMEYVVNLDIVGDIEGGTVVSSTGSNVHLGASSPSYTITPENGYCVYSLSVDGEKIYDYRTDFVTDQLGATQSYTLSEHFEIIADDHDIEAEFRKLVNIEEVEVEALYYSNIGTGIPDMRDDGTYLIQRLEAITYPLVEDYSYMPVGTQQTIKLHFSENAGIVFDDIKIQISLDGGESYLYPFGWEFNQYLFAYGISYDATNKTITIDQMVEGFKLKVVGTPRRANLVIYNYDAETTQEATDVYLFSYYTIPIDGYYWYYCLTSDYHLTNLYINATIEDVETGMGGELHRILLNANMLQIDENDVAQSKIVLIYSSSPLTK